LRALAALLGTAKAARTLAKAALAAGRRLMALAEFEKIGLS
jgi:hypothetical protein